VGKLKLTDIGNEGSIRFHIKQQKGPNTFQTTSNLNLAKAELQSLCESFKNNIGRWKTTEIMNNEEEVYTSCNIREKVLSPQLIDYMKIECVIAADQITHKLLCKVLALVPDVVITIRPIKGFAVVSTPLSKALLQRDFKAKGFQTGFITLDQERRIVPLHQSDPKAKTYTLVGIWISGLEATINDADFSLTKCKTKEEKARKLTEKEDQKTKVLNNQLVIAAILRFIFSEDITSRMSPYPKPHENKIPSYLLVNFGGPLPQFLEFRLKDRNNSWMLLESSHNIPREQKNTFESLQINLSSKKTWYKFSDVISTWQKPKVRTQSRKTRNSSKENFNPNQRVDIESSEPKHVKGKYKIARNVDKSVLQSDDDDLNCARVIRSNTEDSKLNKRHLRNDYKSTIKDKIDQDTSTQTNGYEGVYYMKSSPIKTLVSQNELITPTQKNSLSTSSNSNGLHTSFQGSNVQSRPRLDQFPSYSGNTSLIRTPEYSAVTSASKSSPYLGRIVMEQQKQIQALQQELACLTEMMHKMAQNKSVVNGSMEANISHGRSMVGCSVPDISKTVDISDIKVERKNEVSVEKKEVSVEKKVKLKGKSAKGAIVFTKNPGKLGSVYHLLNKSNTQKKITIKDSAKGAVMDPEEYNFPKIIDVDASMSNNTVEGPNLELNLEGVKKFREDIVDHNVHINSKENIMSESDWTMKVPTIEYNAELSSSRNPNH